MFLEPLQDTVLPKKIIWLLFFKITSIPWKKIPSAVVYYYCAWYHFLWNGRYGTSSKIWMITKCFYIKVSDPIDSIELLWYHLKFLEVPFLGSTLFWSGFSYLIPRACPWLIYKMGHFVLFLHGWLNSFLSRFLIYPFFCIHLRW